MKKTQISAQRPPAPTPLQIPNLGSIETEIERLFEGIPLPPKTPSALKLAVIVLFAASLAIVYSPATRSLVLNPLVLAAVAVSLLPAALTAFYIRESHPDTRAPWVALAAVGVLGAVAVTPAYLLNESALPWFQAVPAAGFLLFLLLFVGPLEEALKAAALHLYPDGGRTVSAVDGAVLGAFAGLGFAFGENALYIVSHALVGPNGVAEVLIGRTAVSPLHVLWSATAGYYIYRARNTGYTVSSAVKALLAVGLLHGSYNAGVHWVPGAVQTSPLGGQAGYLVLAVAVYAVSWIAIELLIRRERTSTTQSGTEHAPGSGDLTVEVV